MPDLSDCLASIGTRDTIRKMLKRAEAGQLEIAYEESGSIVEADSNIFPYSTQKQQQLFEKSIGASD